MSINTELIAHAPTGSQQQFQSGYNFRQDRHASAPANASVLECELLVDLEDISLAMRQFYQAPVRNAG